LVGYSKGGATQSAARLLTNANVRARIEELKAAIAAGVVHREICARSARIEALQYRWNRLRASLDSLLNERGADMAHIPGGSSGLLCRDFKGKDANVEVSRVDSGLVSLLAELREIEQHASVELGQWRPQFDSTVRLDQRPTKSALPDWLLDRLRLEKARREDSGDSGENGYHQ
jgi:hypothetical protein